MEPRWKISSHNHTSLRLVEELTHILALIYTWACCCCSKTKLCPTLCDPMDCSTPGSSVLHSLPKFAQSHVHWVSDAIQPSHPLSSPSPPAYSLSHHQGLFQWAGSSHQVAKVLELQLRQWPFQWAPRVDLLQNWLAAFPCCPRGSQRSPAAPQCRSISSSELNLPYFSILTSAHDYWIKHNFDHPDLCRPDYVSAL